MEPMEIIILGSGSIVPTSTRNHAAIWLRHEGDVLLWDCGEGTQQQLFKAGLSPMKINKIMITHWHTDHYAGLFGLLETLNLEGRREKLQIIGPEASKFVYSLLKLSYTKFEYEIEVIDLNQEIKKELIIKEKSYQILAVPAKHSIPALAYCFKEQDRWNRLLF